MGWAWWASFSLVLLVFIRDTEGRVTDASVTNDGRRTIVIDEGFGFSESGHVEFEVKDFQHIQEGQSRGKIDLARLGFFIYPIELEGQLEVDLAQSKGTCALEDEHVLTVLTMDEVNRDEQADMYTTTFKAALADRMKDFKGGEYALFFQNCEEMLLVTFDLRVSLYNVGKSGNKDYLPVGEDVLPTLYMVMFVLFAALGSIWATVIYKSRSQAHRVHYLMGVLILAKTLTLLSQAGMYHLIRARGHPEGWNLAYYLFTFLRGLLFFTVIVLVGTGWSYMKPLLAKNEKGILIVVIPLQVCAEVAIIYLDETTPASRSWLTWRDILHVVDIICCCAILFPIVWSINHLRKASETDGKAARNLVKLQLFQQFYVIVVSYVYFTRIVVYLLRSTMSYKYPRAEPIRMEEADRWKELDYLFTRPANVTGPGFEPSEDIRPFLRSDVRILCVGAGGLGCELLKDLALSGFGSIDVIDMDTIDVSNLNRQFLFRMEDVGKAKATVAAARVMSRVQGVNVVPHFCRIEEKPLSFYEQFHVIILGLDSLEARRYMNQVACSFLDFDENGEVDQSTIKPMIDGGTEGFKGHARVILPGFTPCFECTLWLFPPQTKYPLCTLAETPRSAPHCIEYAHLIQWGKERPAEDFDPDIEEHMKWVFDKAVLRAEQFGIPGVTYQLTSGVVKNIIPAIASTNAIIAAACTLEALKMVTMCSTGLDNYMMYSGTEGIYTPVFKNERSPTCPLCSPGIPFTVDPDSTLQEVIEKLVEKRVGDQELTSPSISYGSTNLYMRGPLEETTRPNLQKRICELLGSSGNIISVNDKKLLSPLRVKILYSDAAMVNGDS